MNLEEYKEWLKRLIPELVRETLKENWKRWIQNEESV